MRLKTIFHNNVALASILASVAVSLKVNAAELQASDGSMGDNFGSAVASINGSCLIGAPDVTVDQAVEFGTCYLFRTFPTGSVTATEDVKLIPSDTDPSVLRFGESVAFSGNIALVSRRSTYSIYLYQNLDMASGTVMEDAQIDSYRGFGISLSSVRGLLGTSYYRNLDQLVDNPTPDANLGIAANPAYTFYCNANSLSGSSALVGYIDDVPNDARQGAAYYYKDLSTAVGTVTEDVKLSPPGSRSNKSFGASVSLSGNRAIVGAPTVEFDEYHSGEAYYYRDLGSTLGVVLPQTQLQGNPANLSKKNNYALATALSLSGDNALVSAGGNGAFLYLHLDHTSGVVYEDVKIVSSTPSKGGFVGFGESVSLDVDRFVVGDRGHDLNTGAVYTGSVSALTTNDFGNSRKVAAYVSFISHLDWIAGETTDNNQIPLAAGDTATVKDAGKAVYIGKNAGSDNNLLDIAGTLNATYVYIGSTAVNTGNTLQVESTGKITASALRLATGNRLLIAGTPAAAKTFLQKAPLQVWVAGAWKTVTPANYRSLVKISQANGFTLFVPAG